MGDYCISIHALLAESDKCSLGNPRKKPYFYPRSPCGERPKLYYLPVLFCEFLSTLSLRRATIGSGVVYTDLNYFYPRSPCGERLYFPDFSGLWHDFYPRSPCGERLLHCTTYLNCSLFLSTLSLRRATLRYAVSFSAGTFLSTLSLRRATHYDNYNLHCTEISIHALLAESDS